MYSFSHQNLFKMLYYYITLLLIYLFVMVPRNVKNLTAMQESGVQSLSQQDALLRRKCNPLQCSCLENSKDREAWWATYSPWSRKESDMTEQLTHPYCYQSSPLTFKVSKPSNCFLPIQNTSYTFPSWQLIDTKNMQFSIQEF